MLKIACLIAGAVVVGIAGPAIGAVLGASAVKEARSAGLDPDSIGLTALMSGLT